MPDDLMVTGKFLAKECGFIGRRVSATTCNLACVNACTAFGPNEVFASHHTASIRKQCN